MARYEMHYAAGKAEGRGYVIVDTQDGPSFGPDRKVVFRSDSRSDTEQKRAESNASEQQPAACG